MKRKIISGIVASMLMFSYVSAHAVILDDENIYIEREIYNLDFTGANTVDGVYKATTDEEKAIVKTWQPEGLWEDNIFSAFGGVNTAYTYQVVKDDEIKENDEVLKLTASASSASKSVYTDITTGVASDDYYISDGDVLSISFDFLANGSYMVMRTGRTVGEDADGNIELIKGEGQRLLKITPEAQLIMFGTTYGNTLQLPMYSDEDQTEYGHDNKWHNVELLMGSDNKYKVYFDGNVLNDGEWLNFVTTGASDSKKTCTFAEADEDAVPIKFRGFTTLRIYNGFNVTSSTYYYDNFKYTVYENVTDEYEPPVISFENITETNINLEEGDEYPLHIVANTVCPEKMNVYIDDELVYEYNGKEYDYTYVATAGIHTVSAEMTDTQGAVSDRCDVTFVVSPKIDINGSFAGGKVSGTYYEADEKNVSFVTECANGLGRVEFYINSKKVLESKENETELDFSQYGAGNLTITAIVYDSEGKSKSFEYIATVNLSKTTELWSEDYSTYTDAESSSIGSNIEMVAKNGYYAPVTVDTEHGTSLALGVDTGNGSDTGAFVNFANSMGTSHIIFETDFYISDYPGEADAVRKEIHFDMIESSSMQNAMFKINSTEIYKGSQTMPYEKEKWYRLKIDFDMPNKVYSIYIDGESLAEDIDLSKEKEAFASLNAIRCYGPGVEGLPCFIAFDNTSLVNLESHGIVSITNKDGNTEISAEDKMLNLKLSQGVLPESLSIDKVKISGDAGELKIESVAYDDANTTVVVKICDNLISGKNYSISISGDVLSESGLPLGSAINALLAVKNDAPISIDYSQYNDSELLLYVTSDNEKEVYFVVTAWDGKKYLGMKIQKMTVKEGTDIFNLQTGFNNDDMSLNVYVLDSLYKPNMLINDIYVLEV